jgi:hypothetical protein
VLIFCLCRLIVNGITFLNPRNVNEGSMTGGASEYFVLFRHKVFVASAVEVRHRRPGTAQGKRKDDAMPGVSGLH